MDEVSGYWKLYLCQFSPEFRSQNDEPNNLHFSVDISVGFCYTKLNYIKAGYNRMKYQLCINTGIGDSTESAIPLIAAAGFDGCFTGWKPGALGIFAALIRESGMIYQSVHAPFKKMNVIWEDESAGGAGDEAADELCACIRESGENGVPIVVVHPIIGMDRHTPTSIGIARFARVLEAAEAAGVRAAFENVEGIEYLERIISELGDHPAIGFCWDTGHEMCYNHRMDVPALFGDKLICTHLNDNMGQTDPAVVTWYDDSHMLPFDGTADWAGIAARLKRTDFTAPLTFELNRAGRPGKHTHDRYASLDTASFIRECFARAAKFAEMM